MGFLSKFFAVEEEDTTEEKFEELEEEKLIKREDYTYRYNKPKLLETIEGNFKEWESWILKDPRLITVCGMRRSGKSCTIASISENIGYNLKRPIFALGMENAILPNFVFPVETIEEVPNDTILMVGEGAVEANARDSMSNKNKNLAKLLPIISHKGIYATFCSQSGYKVDKNLIFEADTIILHKPSLMQLEGERKAVKDLYGKYLKRLNYWTHKLNTIKGITAVHSESFKGIVYWKLPSWWNDSLSRSYRGVDVYD